jgi:hypothetical protein
MSEPGLNEELESKIAEQVLIMKNRTRWIRLLSMLFLVISLFTFVFVTRHQSNKIVEQNKAILKKDSVALKQTQDSVAEYLRRSILNQRIDQYFSLVNAHHYDSLQLLYADTLLRYFKSDSNIEKSKINKKIEEHCWSAEYRHSAFTMSHSPVILGDTAWVSGIFTEERNVNRALVIQLQFNDSAKINFIRALYDK